MLVARVILVGLVSAVFAGSVFAGEPKKVTYEDDVLPIFRDNCLKCHNPDKLKGDLDLTSFSSAVKGGGSGATLSAGDPDGSQLFKSVTHADEPSMPPNAKIPDKDIAIIRRWIEGGLLQGLGSKALAANKPATDLSLKVVSIGKPDGPPPMPLQLGLDPAVISTRGSALGAIAHSPWAPVVALAASHQIVLYNTSDLEFLGVLPFREGFPCDLKFSRNGKLLLASGGRGGQSGLVAVWDIVTGERVITIGDQFDSVLAADLSSDQRWIALGGPDRVLKIYRTSDGSLEHRIKKHTEWVTAVEFSPDSKFLATGDRNGGVVLWEAESGQEMFSLPGHKGGITAITWRGDSAMFGSASEDGTLKLWKASDGTLLRSIAAHAGGALAARFASDGRLVSCGRDNKIQIWDTNGKNLRTLVFNGDLPHRVSFSDDGKKVIGSDWKGTVFVWDAVTGKALGELDSHPPTLTERVERIGQQLATLQTAARSATSFQLAREGDATCTEQHLVEAKKSLLHAKSALVVREAELTALTTSGPTPDPDASAVLKGLRTQVSLLQRDLATTAKHAAMAVIKATEAKSAAAEAKAKLTATQASLTKWQAVLQNAPDRAAAGKVSAR